MTLAYAELARAELALGRGDHDAGARRCSTRRRPLAADSREPQFIGWPGALRAELERRGGDLAAARAAVDDALDRIEFCTEDLARIALAGAGRRARSRPTPPSARATSATRDGRARGDRARRGLLCARRGAAPRGARPVEARPARDARAELRARARRGRPGAGRRGRGGLGDASAPATRRAVARLREAEALAAARRPRGRRRAAVDGARAPRDALGAAWLRGEVEGLAARARLRARATGGAPSAAEPRRRRPSEPFGLTPRERQVLALVADGATNREIGAQLFMAEKTASVHVSRILAKLDVRSRTEAAAVAHRLGLG